jgi:hypothetical protein
LVQPLNIEGPGGGGGGVSGGGSVHANGGGAASTTAMRAGLTGAFPRSASAVRLAAAAAAAGESTKPLRDDPGTEDDVTPRPGG